MTFLLVMFAVVTAINLGCTLCEVSNLGENATDKQTARLFLCLITFVAGIVMIEPLPIASVVMLLLSLACSNWKHVARCFD
jgi:uncharacterized membrane protein